MRVFVVSDIHGQFRALNDVLKQVNFDANVDTLYVLGDMIDWGTSSLAVVLELHQLQVRHPKNIFISKGNHECMCVSAMKYNNMQTMAVWFGNGGGSTYSQLSVMAESERVKLLDWLDNLPVYFETADYYLTHSCPVSANAKILDNDVAVLHNDLSDSVIQAVWNRVRPDELNLNSKILISGHTQTAFYSGKFEAYFDMKNNYINIDCNAKAIGLTGYDGRLCLLEVPSYKTYYSEVK
jgi:predicted MPP superfamily phosphohydrolase